jgi:hypothetical protein
LSKRVLLFHERSLPVEAQQTETKPKRLSELSFEPGFKLEFTVDNQWHTKELDREMVMSLIAGIDKRNPWYAPNDSSGVPDQLELRWIEGKKSVRCTLERSVLKEQHLDAFLRYIQNIGRLLCVYLAPFGVLHTEVLLDLTSYICAFTHKPPTEKLNIDLELEDQVR